jgi:heme-degrading monooxygenase HmoA
MPDPTNVLRADGVSYLRIWRARLDLARLDEYEQWIEERSKPMFEAQRGFRGVVYARRDEEVVVLTLWEDKAAVEALTISPSYQQAVRDIEATGFLIGASRLDVYRIDAAIVDEGLSGIAR